MSGIQDIIAALASWPSDPSPLIGVFESRDLEFKMTAYQLGTAAGKAEFAKDVGGMANAGGGLIVLGIETERDPATGRDRSSKVRPIRTGIISILRGTHILLRRLPEVLVDQPAQSVAPADCTD